MAADLKTRILDRLIDGGDWMNRAALAAGLSSSPVAQDEALADLVIEGRAEYLKGKGYRLAGGVLQRRAAQLLRRKRLCRAVLGHQEADQYVLGVAEMRQVCPGAELSLVMYEMVLPMPAPGPQHLEQHMRQMQAVVDFSKQGCERG